MKHSAKTIPGEVGAILESLEASESQRVNLSTFVEALTNENRINNLISRSDVDNIWTRHILHSLAPLVVCSLPAKARVVDIGSGGGFPGIPIAIMRPDYGVFLVESIRKKAESLGRIVQSIGLSNTTVVHSRVEELGKKSKFGRSIDLCFARAVAPLERLIFWADPLLSKREFEIQGAREGAVKVSQSALIAFKGGNIEREISEAKRKYPALTISEHPIEFSNLLEEKKLLVVYP